MGDFLDFRTAPKASGGFIGATDFSYLGVGEDKAIRFFYGTSPDDVGLVHVMRTLDGELSIITLPHRFEPVMEGEQLIGLRFPGSDRYPWQPKADGER